MKIADGHYTLIYPAGEYRTLRVRTSRKGNLVGKTILSIKQGSEFAGIAFLTDENKVAFWNRFRKEAEPARLERIQKAVERIAADPVGAGLAYALKENRCCKCTKRLTVPASIHNGMGPECARKNWTREDQKQAYLWAARNSAVPSVQ